MIVASYCKIEDNSFLLNSVDVNGSEIKTNEELRFSSNAGRIKKFYLCSLPLESAKSKIIFFIFVLGYKSSKTDSNSRNNTATFGKFWLALVSDVKFVNA